MKTTTTAKSVRQCIDAMLILTGALASFAAIAVDSQPQEHIVVEAGRFTTKVISRSDLGMPIVRVELKGQVSYSDLDLSIDSNAKVLKQRVHDAARIICSDIEKVYPILESVRDCSSRAERDAMQQVNAAIMAAQKKRAAQAQ